MERLALSEILKFIETGERKNHLRVFCPGCKAHLLFTLCEPIEKLYQFAQRHGACIPTKKIE